MFGGYDEKGGVRNMRLVSCSECFSNFPLRQTTIREGKRICHGCMSEKRGKSEDLFDFAVRRGEKAWES